MPFADRRKHPRISEAIPCRAKLGACLYEAHTRNLSCGGALCQFLEPIPLMTKLEIAIELPPVSPGFSSHWIHCVGVVVRQDPQMGSEGARSYLTALYFSELKPEDRQEIAEFVLRSMLSYDRRRS